MKLNTNVRIKVNSNAEKLAALEILSEVYGLPVCEVSKRLALDGIKNNSGGVSGGDLIGPDHNGIDGYSFSSDFTFNFSEIDKAIEFIKGKKVEVKLNDEYTAEVTKTEIKVGCQTFPISVLDALNDAREELNKGN